MRVVRHTTVSALVAASLLAGASVAAETLTIVTAPITEWKSVFGQVEARDEVPARVRIGGIVVDLSVTEGDRVAEGQRIATVEDDKLQFRLDALDARNSALTAQLETAQAEFQRGQTLIERGVITSQRLDQLRTSVDVIQGEIRSLAAERLVLEQQVTEGQVLSPDNGVVLSVPVSRGSVVVAGETVAVIAGGGFYLRLSVPERHAGDLVEGDEIEIGANGPDVGAQQTGRLVKLYPLIEGGRVQADVEVDRLDGRFVGRRVPVRLPVGERVAILVPEQALERRGGLDLVIVEAEGAARERPVVPGGTVVKDGAVWVEILTGLVPGDKVVLTDE